jgi:hypothetical protein
MARLITPVDVWDTVGGEYPTTMLTTNTGLQNAAALMADTVVAATTGKDVIIPGGTYHLALDPTTPATFVADIAGKIGTRWIGFGARLVVDAHTAAGNQESVFQITTKSGWEERSVTAFEWLATGTTATPPGTAVGLDPIADTSGVTIASAFSSALKRNETLSLYSNDPIFYRRSDGRSSGTAAAWELNWQHEMHRYLMGNSSTALYLAWRTKRPFTAAGGANKCFLRRYNNQGMFFEMFGITWDVNGSCYDQAVPNAQRPKSILQIYGIDNVLIDQTVTVAQAWQGDFQIGNSIHGQFNNAIRLMPNKSATIASLGYGPAVQGANLMTTIGARQVDTMRHQTTIWSEAAVYTISAATVGATTTFTTDIDTNSQVLTMAVGDTIIPMELVGTISAMNGQKCLITAVTNTGSPSRTTSVTVSYNSTGLARTSGGRLLHYSEGRIYGPTSGSIHYGESVSMNILGGTGVGLSGGIDDEHENADETTNSNRIFYGGAADLNEDTAGTAVNNRGSNATYSNYKITNMAQAARLHSFSQNHGIPNTVICRDFTIVNESNRPGSAALFEVINYNNANPVDTAVNATTNAAGYAINATSITLAAAGTGAIVDGGYIYFAGDKNRYRVATGLANVAAGGTIILADGGLKQAIAAAATGIVVGEPKNLILDRGSVQGGYYTFLANPVGGPDTLTRNWHMQGDWGVPPTTSKSIFMLDTGRNIVEDTIFDFSKNYSGAALIRLLTTGAACETIFRRCDFRNLFAPSAAGQYPILLNFTGCILTFEDCKIRFDTSKAAQRFISVAASCNVVVNFINTQVYGASTIDAARGLINISNTAAVVTGLKSGFTADAAIAIAGTTVGAGSSYTPTALSAL